MQNARALEVELANQINDDSVQPLSLSELEVIAGGAASVNDI